MTKQSSSQWIIQVLIDSFISKFSRFFGLECLDGKETSYNMRNYERDEVILKWTKENKSHLLTQFSGNIQLMYSCTECHHKLPLD